MVKLPTAISEWRGLCSADSDEILWLSLPVRCALKSKETVVGRDDIAWQQTVILERLPARRLSHFVRTRLPRNKASMLPPHQIDVLTGGFDTRLPFLPAWLGRIDRQAFLGSAARRKRHHGQIDDRNEDQTLLHGLIIPTAVCPDSPKGEESCAGRTSGSAAGKTGAGCDGTTCELRFKSTVRPCMTSLAGFARGPLADAD